MMLARVAGMPLAWARTAVRGMSTAGAQRDFYRDLGIERDASADEVKSAYRALAKKWHPDTREPSQDANAPDHDMFRYLTEAHDILKDPHKRALYDRELFGGGSSVLVADIQAQSHAEAARASDAELRASRERVQRVVSSQGRTIIHGQDDVHDRSNESFFQGQGARETSSENRAARRRGSMSHLEKRAGRRERLARRAAKQPPSHFPFMLGVSAMMSLAWGLSNAVGG